MMAAKCLHDDSLGSVVDFAKSELSSPSPPNIPLLDDLESSSLRMRKRPALLLKMNDVVVEIQYGTSMLISCILRRTAVRTKANTAIASESR